MIIKSQLLRGLFGIEKETLQDLCFTFNNLSIFKTAIRSGTNVFKNVSSLFMDEKNDKDIEQEEYENFKKNLIKFFKQRTLNIKAPYKIQGSQIQKKVWSELRKIRPGQTKTYGEIAKKFKLSPRYIGKICSQNKIVLVIPCHRVIRSDGSMGGFSSAGGISLKQKLLDFENSWKH
jgi:methylated-DNA-[protein]-cysteine S-methyltransferase|tara:strand:- start:643 stop:1170 length:528 start_codon:yes stop_codon:yes gene_type:complete